MFKNCEEARLNVDRHLLLQDAALVTKVTGQTAATLSQIVATLIAGLVIAFSNSWRLTLIILIIVPFVALAGALEFRELTGYGSKTKVAYEEAGQVSNEAISNIRTVVILGREETFKAAYERSIEKPHRVALRGAFTSGVGHGLSQGMMFIAFVSGFKYAQNWILISQSSNRQFRSCMEVD